MDREILLCISEVDERKITIARIQQDFKLLEGPNTLELLSMDPVENAEKVRRYRKAFRRVLKFYGVEREE